MGQAAASPWGTGPVYRPPDARPEWEEAGPRPVRPGSPFRSAGLRVDAERAETALADVALGRARQELAVRRRLHRATAQATQAVELRRRRAEAEARQQAEAVEAERLEAEVCAQQDAAARARVEAEVVAAREVAERVARARAAAAEEARDRNRREEARRAEHRRRLALATKLERTAGLLRDYEQWARSRGLRAAADAGLSVEADRLGHHIDELRYG